MSWLLRLYPKAWRRRYGDEIAEVVAAQPASLQLAVDLIGGAIDARLRPQAFARRMGGEADARGGPDMVNRLKSADAVVQLSARDGGALAGWTMLMGIAMAVVLMLVQGQFSRAIALAVFPAALGAPMQWVMLRGHSRLVRTVLMAGPLAVCLLIGVVAGLAVSD